MKKLKRAIGASVVILIFTSLCKTVIWFRDNQLYIGQFFLQNLHLIGYILVGGFVILFILWFTEVESLATEERKRKNEEIEDNVEFDTDYDPNPEHQFDGNSIQKLSDKS